MSSAKNTKSDAALPQALRVTETTPIGQGGMAMIFRAKQPSLNRYVVVKQVKPELLTHATVLKRFEREAMASSKLLHQNLAHVYDYVTTDGSPYIVMEYIDGVDVADILGRRGTMPIPIALAIMYGVTRALAYVHSHGLVHRDIKPENIRISSKGEVKLMDFGIALQAEDSKLTLPGIIIGSPHYLSPEQVLGEKIDHRSDLFALGITLYEFITGTRPFDDADQTTVFKNIRTTKYVPARKVNKAIPRGVDKMIRKLLQGDPRMRYQSAIEVHRELRQLLHTDDEKPMLHQYLVFEAFIQPSSDEIVTPPKLEPPWWKTKLGIGVALSSLLFAFALGFGVAKKPWERFLPKWFPAKVAAAVPTPAPTPAPQPTPPPEPVFYCLINQAEGKLLTDVQKQNIMRALIQSGLPTNSFPRLETITVAPNTQQRVRQAIQKANPKEQKFLFEVNGASHIQGLLLKRKVMIFTRPPCK